MNIGDRIRKLRKSLDLTQREFGERVNLKSNSIALIEGGRNTSDQTISSICREFDVNETWLRTGEGEMFKPKTSNALEKLARERGLSHGAYILLEKLLNLRPEVMEGIVDVCLEVAAAMSGDDVKASDAACPFGVPAGMSDADLHAELDRQISEEKEAADGSSASGCGSSGTVVG